MTLQIPDLDSRDFEQLRADLLARIPVHTPEWTHAGESDPGVTMLELFAFLAENLLYRCNQVPERNQILLRQCLPLRQHPGLVVARQQLAPIESGGRAQVLQAPAALENGVLELAGGQSGHFLSPHFRDQQADWIGGTPTPFLGGAPVTSFALEP